jgi:hypothetical protein
MKNVIPSACIAFAAILTISSCKKDNSAAPPDPGDKAVAVQFGSNIGGIVYRAGTSLLKATGSSWDAADAIGVFMVDNGTVNVRNSEANKKYVTTAGDGTFTPATSTDTVYYPINGDKVDFIACYPYASSIASLGAYPVNVADQSNPAAIDLLYAKATNSSNGYDKTNALPVTLSFSHQLSKLTLNVSAPISSTQIAPADLTGMTVSIAGLNTQAQFDLTAGTLGSGSNVTNITPFTATAGAKYEAILLPGSFSGVSVTFGITAGNNPGNYVWNVPDGAFETGKEYVYNISFTGTAGDVSVTGAINPWDVIDSEIVLTSPADNASVNAYVAAFPVTFTWNKVPTVSGYTLKLSPTGDFTTVGAFVAFDAGDNDSYDLDKTTCEGLLATVAAAAGSAYTGKAALQWMVEPSAGQPTNVAVQTRTLYAIGGESAFPYELNDGTNSEEWTVTATCGLHTCASYSSGTNDGVPENMLLGDIVGSTHGERDKWWHINESLCGMGDDNGAYRRILLVIDMKSVKSVKKITEQIRFMVGNSVISTSTDNINWTQHSPTLTFTWSNHNQQMLELTNPVEARYIRIQISAAWPATDGSAGCWAGGFSINRVWVYGSNNGE